MEPIEPEMRMANFVLGEVHKAIEEGHGLQRSLKGDQRVQGRAEYDEAQSWRIFEGGEPAGDSHVLVNANCQDWDDHHHALDDRNADQPSRNRAANQVMNARVAVEHRERPETNERA